MGSAPVFPERTVMSPLGQDILSRIVLRSPNTRSLK
jgi:hypothetical protein